MPLALLGNLPIPVPSTHSKKVGIRNTAVEDPHLCTSLSQPPELEPTRLESFDTQTNMSKQQKNGYITWQQLADFVQAPVSEASLVTASCLTVLSHSHANRGESHNRPF